MSLNSYRDEAAEFIAAIGAGEEDVSRILDMLDEETLGLKRKAASGEAPELCHQIYDVLFLLFELAARFDLDLDGEWATGRERKRQKYLKGGGENHGD